MKPDGETRKDKPMSLLTRAFMRTGLLAGVFVLANPTAHGSGPTVHLLIGDEARKRVVHQDLKLLLDIFQRHHYAMGLLFPDSTNTVLPPVRWWDGCPCPEPPCPDPFGPTCFSAHSTHSAHFLNAYVTQMVRQCGEDFRRDATWNPCSRLLTHFMGVLGHIVGDHRFDHYFLSRTDSECDFDNLFHGQDTGPGSQGFTDFAVDTAVVGFHPEISSSPQYASIPWAHCAPQCDLETIFKAAFPHAQIGTESEIYQTVALHLELVRFFRRLFPYVNLYVSVTCPWTIDNYDDAFGGTKDSGAVLAQYLDKTWEILTDGDPATIPNFEAGFFRFPNDSLSVFEVGGGNPWKFDYSSWIHVPSPSGVDEFQLEETETGGNSRNRIAYRSGGSLHVLDTGSHLERFDFTAPLPRLATPGPISDFQLSGQRIGVRVGDQLWVKDTLSSPWVLVAESVIEYQLDGNHIAAVVSPGGPFHQILAKRGAAGSGWDFIAITPQLDHFEFEWYVEGQQEHVRMGRLANGEFWIRDGLLHDQDADWVLVRADAGIDEFQLDRNRVGVLIGGEFWLQEGALDSEFRKEQSNVARLRMQGDWLGVATGDGELRIRSNSTGEWFVKTVANVSSFELLDKPDGADMFTCVHNHGLHVGNAGSGPSQDLGLPRQGNISQVRMKGARIGVVVDGELYVLVSPRHGSEFAHPSEYGRVSHETADPRLDGREVDRP